MSSTFANPRRQPQQNRAEVRRASFLDAAERLIGSHGYEAVTMTAIAEQAGASIGTLYDYFPDKPAVATALMQKYMQEAEVHWAAYLQPAPGRSREFTGDLFIEGILEFVRSRPAYLPLYAAPIAGRSKAAREPLRKTIAAALESMRPGLAPDRAFLNAQVIVEIIRGLLSVYRQAAVKDREAVVAEFKKVMRLYLADSLA